MLTVSVHSSCTTPGTIHTNKNDDVLSSLSTVIPPYSKLYLWQQHQTRNLQINSTDSKSSTTTL